VDHVHRQTHAQRRAQGLRADDVAAADHRLGAEFLRRLHGAGERLGAVVAVGDDANPQRL